MRGSAACQSPGLLPTAGKPPWVSGRYIIGCVSYSARWLQIEKQNQGVGSQDVTFYILDMNKLKHANSSNFVDEETMVQKGEFSVTKHIIGSFIIPNREKSMPISAAYPP